MRLRRVVLICGLCCVIAAPALAHKFGGPNDPCERKIGGSLIHITLYQPEFDPDAEYCDALPRAGNTVFVLDTLGDDLRKVPIGVRILAMDGSRPGPAVLSLAPAVYRRGVVDAQVTLAEGRGYIARVSIAWQNGASPVEYSFPIRVSPWYRALVLPVLMVLGVLALVAISIVRYRLRVRARFRGRRRSAALIPIGTALLAFCLVSAGCRASVHAPAMLPDVHLIDDHGRPVQLNSLKGKVILLNFVHIGCPGVCDNLTNKFGQIADAIRPELGTRVMLVTVTNDPEHDGPEQLLKLARNMQADMSGWLFLTGKPEDVNQVIAAFGVDNTRLPDGSPNHITRVFMLGSDLRQQREFAGMAMNSQAVASELMNQVQRGGA